MRFKNIITNHWTVVIVGLILFTFSLVIFSAPVWVEAEAEDSLLGEGQNQAAESVESVESVEGVEGMATTSYDSTFEFDDFEIEASGDEVRNLSLEEKQGVIDRVEYCRQAESDNPSCYGASAQVDIVSFFMLEDKTIISFKKYENQEAKSSLVYELKYQTTVKLFGFFKHEVIAQAVVRHYPDPKQTEKYTSYDVPWYIRWFIWSAPEEERYLNLLENVVRGVSY